MSWNSSSKGLPPVESLPPDLRSLRSRIDEIDADLIGLIAARVKIARQTVAVKEANGLAMVDLAREAEVVRRAAVLARESGVEPEGTRDVFWKLIALSRWAAAQEIGVAPTKNGPEEEEISP